jgi:ketosteroid isomerase-like protein
MSDENVELVRRVDEAWNEGGPEALKQFLAEDFELHDPPNLPDSRVVRGRDAAAAYLTDQLKVLGDMKVTIVDVRARRGTVVVRMEVTIHGARKWR